MRHGKNPDATVELFPGLNHLFQHSKTGLPAEYGTIEETFASEALQRLCDWIADRTARLYRWAPGPPRGPRQPTGCAGAFCA